MNVTHIIDKLREKYKDHEDYWTKEDILNENKKNSDSTFGQISSNFIKDVIQKNDVFGILPFFIFEKCEKLDWKEDKDILLYTNPSFHEEIREEFLQDTFYFYRVYTFVPMVGVKKKLFSENKVFKYFKSDIKCKRNGYKYEYMFTSFLCNIKKKLL